MVKWHEVIWATAGGIIVVAIATHTDFIKQLIAQTTKKTGWQDVHTQIECPSDLSKLPVGSTCYKNGHLYRIMTDQQRKAILSPVPIPLQGSVPPSVMPTVMPPTQKQLDRTKQRQERPKRPRQQDEHKAQGPTNCFEPCSCPTGGRYSGSVLQDVVNPSICYCPASCSQGQPEWTLPATHPYVPNIPVTGPAGPSGPSIIPSHPGADQGTGETGEGPAPGPPPSTGPVTNVFYPFVPAGSPQLKSAFAYGFADDYDQNGCKPEHYPDGTGRTCRWVAPNHIMQQNIGSSGYRIDATIHIGDPIDHRFNEELSITSGGPGSVSGSSSCCGFTTRVNIKDGTLQMEAENGAKTEHTYCRGEHCVEQGQPYSIAVHDSNGKPQPLYNSDVSLSWVWDGQAYHMEATGPSRQTVVSKKLTAQDAAVRGQALVPFKWIDGRRTAEDSHRVRVDSTKSVNFGNPKVSVLSPTGGWMPLGWAQPGVISQKQFANAKCPPGYWLDQTMGIQTCRPNNPFIKYISETKPAVTPEATIPLIGIGVAALILALILL